MLNIALCDDDYVFLSSFSNQLSQFFNKNQIDFQLFTAHKLSNLYDILHDGTYFDLIFLDIEFCTEENDGVALSLHLRNDLKIDSTALVFVSSKKSYAMSLFESQPLDFLIKPVDNERLEKVLARFLRIKNVMSNLFTFTYYGKEIKLPLSSILYFQSNNHKIRINCFENIFYEYSGKLSYIASQLEDKGFFSPHKSFLVNYYAVNIWKSKELILCNGVTIPISRSHSEIVHHVQLDCEVYV